MSTMNGCIQFAKTVFSVCKFVKCPLCCCGNHIMEGEDNVRCELAFPSFCRNHTTAVNSPQLPGLFSIGFHGKVLASCLLPGMDNTAEASLP